MNTPLLTRLLRDNPVAVTGLGVVSAAGTGTEPLWRALERGTGAAQWLPLRREDGIAHAGCSVAHIPLPGPLAHLARRLDRHAALALAAGSQAWEDAGLAASPPEPSRCGVAVGLSRGPVGAWGDSAARLAAGRVLPSDAAAGTFASAAGAMSMALNASGPVFTLSMACASSSASIAAAAEQLLLGSADVMIAGGAEAPLHPLVLAQLDATGVLGRHTEPALVCRPFDAARNGTVLGEGAAFLILESLAHARQRGATIHALLAGWALGAEATTRTGMDKSGAALLQVMNRALDSAALPAAALGYVNAHGTGTLLNDRQESRALCALLGAHPVPCSSTKAVTGHTMGAAGAMEALISILALRHGSAPPTAACSVPDAGSPPGLVLGAPVPITSPAVLTTSSGFWGSHAALVFTQFPHEQSS